MNHHEITGKAEPTSGQTLTKIDTDIVNIPTFTVSRRFVFSDHSEKIKLCHF